MKKERGGGSPLKKSSGTVKVKEAKPAILNTVFLDIRTSVEECEGIIKAFEGYGYNTYYDAKTKMIKTSAPKTKIKELSKQFKSIQSFNLIDRNPNNEPLK